MLSSFSSINSIVKFSGSSSPPSATITLSSITGNYNVGSFSMSGRTVYQFYNNSTPSATPATGQSGTFTINVSTTTGTIYYIVVGGGGGGGSGSQGGGGGGSGQLQYGSISLPVGSYSCTYIVGEGGYGSGYTGSGSYSNGGNGYGYVGYLSQFACNGNTITASGGGAGGCSYNSNGCTGYACGGGAGCNFSTSNLTGATGSVHNGGASNTSTYTSTGAGGGASNYENGVSGSAGNSSGGNAGSGGRGGRATRSIDLPTPYNGFTTTLYFAEGGSGSCSRTAPSCTTIAPIASYYGYGGYGSGVPNTASSYPTNAIINSTGGWGSGGGGAFQASGVSGTSTAGYGSNGVFFLFF
jgi:hypothetical protein